MKPIIRLLVIGYCVEIKNNNNSSSYHNISLYKGIKGICIIETTFFCCIFLDKLFI